MTGDEIRVGGEIPDRVRQQIDERDQLFCRMCGANTEAMLGGREIHHVNFGGDEVGIGGSRVHDPDLMVSLCRKCHQRSHRQKFKWQKALEYVACRPGITAAQVLRWAMRSETNRKASGLTDANTDIS